VQTLGQGACRSCGWWGLTEVGWSAGGVAWICSWSREKKYRRGGRGTICSLRRLKRLCTHVTRWVGGGRSSSSPATATTTTKRRAKKRSRCKRAGEDDSEDRGEDMQPIRRRVNVGRLQCSARELERRGRGGVVHVLSIYGRGT